MPQLNEEARVLLALQALQNNPKLKLQRAAEIYEVGPMKLWRRRKGILSIHNTIPKSRKLSDLEEQIIVQYILDLDSRGFPPGIVVLKKWPMDCLLIAMHHQLASAGLSIASSGNQTSRRVFRFRLVQNTIAKYGIRLDDIYNFDETGFMMGMIGSGIVITGAERRGKPKSVQPGNREWVTVIQAINAEGWAINPFIVVAGQYHLADWYRESNSRAIGLSPRPKMAGQIMRRVSSG
ncbi:fot5 transposase [Fusarium oxysporum f. sp. phaseoli]